MASDKVKVAVRVRPMNRREIELGTKCVVEMDNNQTVLFHPKDSDAGGDRSGGSRKSPKSFAFDHCFWSIDEKNSKFAGQEKVFECLGRDILQRAYEGYNGCIFAYGQTGSGKSYTMMGTMERKGIIPRLCDALFERIAKSDDDDISFKVGVSYMEIYNEKVHDLLDPKGGKQNLRVREHNILGPYVDGLSTLVVTSFKDIDNLMNEGNKSRTVAATNMNSESSRSHAVFNIIVTQTLVDKASMVSGEKVSKLSLVDLAGSERAQKTGAVGERLKEGSNINKSLTTLGLVISALADQAAGKNRNKFVPYRDSVLTWLLKDNLGGNSKTVMIATVSPAADNYEETLSTLRYADRAKRIINHAVVNEDPNARIIRELREEVETLRNQLSEAQSMKAPDLKDRLEESEKLIKEMSKTWEEKLTETEKIHQERHKALEQMGISVETSGIKVEQGRYYLVNLNADPSLNELLVYYLKEHALVGRTDAVVQQDIQLSGLGIMLEHCIVDIENNDVYLTPLDGARTCVNGSVVLQKTKVKHGDRILWGNNHFFRINCPKPNSVQSSEPEQRIDYDFAQQELMMKELSNDPIQEAISAIEKQYEEDKQEALERQRQMYERQMQMLRNQLVSPGTPSFPFPPFDINRITPSGSTQSSIQKKYQQWAQEREKLFKQSLSKLREEVMKANTLVREANDLAQEMKKQTEFHVTLQIPAANLSPNRRRGAFVSEPAILVKRKGQNSQIWSMEKFENKIIDMRELYDEQKSLEHPLMVLGENDDISNWDGLSLKGDPFFESQENHNLIGVANIFLECLFYDVKLDYHVPIISQQGEITGKLHVEISKLGGALWERYSDVSSEGSDEFKRSAYDSIDEDSGLAIGAPLIVRVCIKEGRGLPPSLSNFVFCQYSFWNQPEPIAVAPDVNPEIKFKEKDDGASVTFAHRKDFKVYITEEFIEHASDGALSIEVWGHCSPGFSNNNQWDAGNRQARSRSLLDRWNEVMRKIEFWVEVHELSDQGEYTPVEVIPKPEVPSAGVFQLRQGHSRRIVVSVKPVANSGTLPLICESISSILIGCICNRSKLQKGLDSYQDEDLNLLGERWSDALMRRKEYLVEHFQKLINKQDKSEAEADREKALVEQWIGLTEERNAVLVPAAGSGIPGAPADSDSPPDMEQHVPVLFLDLNADDMSTPNAKEGLQASGINSILPKEHGAKFFNLPIIKTCGEKDISAVASWDSSIHDSQHLNRVTPHNERVYLILKAIVRLSHPASMELVLRKRICINVYKKQSLTSITDKLKKRITKSDVFYASGVTYEVVSNIPKASEDLENMETLAQMAASQNETNAADGETYIEKYIKGVSAVESILTLDRLRQEVAVKELLSTSGRSLRKTTSVPNIHQALVSPPRLDDQIRADSIQDLSFQELYSPHKSGYFPATPKSAISPHASKAVKPLRTLLEEQQHRERKPLLQQDTEEDLDEEEDVGKTSKIYKDPHSLDSDEFQEFESYQSQRSSPSEKSTIPQRPTTIAHSVTADNLIEIQSKSFTPSMTSSGYGSQAVSTLTLSSEDSVSINLEENSPPKNFLQTPRSIATEESAVESQMVKMSEKPQLSDIINGNVTGDMLEIANLINATTKSEQENVEADIDLLTERRSREDSCSSLMDANVPPISDTPLQPVFPPDNGEQTIHLEESTTEIQEELEMESAFSAKTDSKFSAANTSSKGKESSLVNKCFPVRSETNESTSFESESHLERENDGIDPYSETAMAELEKLGNEGNESIADAEQEKIAVESKEILNTISSEKQILSRDAKTQPVGDINLDNSNANILDSNNGNSTSDLLTDSLIKVKSKAPPNSGKKSVNSSDKRTVDVHLKRAGSGSAKQRRPVSCFIPSTESGFGPTSPRFLMDQTLSTSTEQLSSSEDTLSLCSFGSRADLDRLHEAPLPSWIQLGEAVTVTSSRGHSKTGIVQFLGPVQFAVGLWVGVELDSPEGKNDGMVNGIRYFKCRTRHGVFVRHDKLIWDKRRRNSRKSSGNATANRRSLGNLSRAANSLPLSRSSTNLSNTPSPVAGGSSSSSFMRPTSASSAKKK